MLMAIIILLTPECWLVVLVWRLVRGKALRRHKEALPTVASGKGYTTSTWRSFGKQPAVRPRGSWEADGNVLGFSPYKEIVRIVFRAQPGTP